MDILFWPIVFFIIAFLLHVALWRLRYPRNPIRTLVFLFSAVAAAGALFLFSVTAIRFSHYIYIFSLFFAFFACYLMSYPAIEADSPSMAIVSRVSMSGREGLTLEKIKELLGSEVLVEPRLKDLVDANLAKQAGPVYKISKKGMLFLAPFVVYRNFLGLGKGG